MSLRPIADLPTTLEPKLAVPPDELHAIGKVGDQQWHASKFMAVAGAPPKGARKPEAAEQNFGGWLTRRKWSPIEPVGWWNDGESDIVTFSPEFTAKGESGYRRNFANGRYFTAAVRLGAVSWEMRRDGAVMVARDAEGTPVAFVACMRIPKDGFPE